jgi:hypothetical protein
VYYLTLSERPVPGGPLRQLGTIQIQRERVDLETQVASYTLECQGEQVGKIHGWRLWRGPWRLAQAALNTLYGGQTLPGDTVLKADGQCNEWTQRRRRCRIDAQEGSYFCIVHNHLR